ncbi:MAG: TetR/AcrR family transcriptional regulator [Dorea sp.]
MSKTKQTSTKQILAEAFFSLLEKQPFHTISVHEICEKAGIGRSTFYLHFDSKYDLLSFCLEISSQKLDELLSTYPLKDFFVILLDTFQENTKILYHVFESELNENLVKMFYQIFNRHLTEHLKEKEANGQLLPGPVESVAAFYVGGLVNMIIQWIISDYKLPKETLASCQYKLLQDIL